jgi:hypothetical protein
LLLNIEIFYLLTFLVFHAFLCVLSPKTLMWHYPKHVITASYGEAGSDKLINVSSWLQPAVSVFCHPTSEFIAAPGR